MRRLWAAALVVLVPIAAAGCSGSRDEVVSGIVVEVEGDLTNVDYFDLVAPDGTRYRFEPAPGVTFHDSAPLSHLRDHLRNGERIEVRYELLDDGTYVAFEVDDT